MAFSGGVFRPEVPGTQYIGDDIWSQMALAMEKVRPDRFDAVWGDLAAAIGMLVLRNGANTPTANLPMGAKRHVGVQDAVDRSDYASFGQLLDAAGAVRAGGERGRHGECHHASANPGHHRHHLPGWVGLSVRHQVENTGPVMISVSGLSQVALTPSANGQFAAEQLKVGALVLTVFDGTRFQAIGQTLRWTGSQAEYDALTPDPNTLYLITS